MRLFTPALLALTFGLTASAVADNAVPPGARLVPGSSLPKAASLRPASQTVKPYATGTTYKGKVTASFRIDVLSAISTSIPIYCDIGLAVTDENALADQQKSEFAEATRSGNSATCTVVMPYAFNQLSSPGSDTLTVTYSLFAGFDAGAAISGYASGALVNGTFYNGALPANGANTAATVAETL